jgi:DNA invertase Pin-like site-specific DNA recombinase
MKVAIYTRVSTRDCSKLSSKAQEENERRRQDTENQAVQLRAFAAQQGWIIAGEYTDRMSGKRSDRPAMAQLMTDAQQRKCDVVLAWALDRFTREGVSETFDYIRRLRDVGVEFWSLTEPHFRTTGPAGELMIAVAAWIAKQERVRISERVNAGLDRARREGKVLGRPRVVFDRLKVRELRESGQSLRAIAEELDLSLTTVARSLKAS